MLAVQHATAGRPDAAIQELRSVLSTYPNFAPARTELIKGLQSLGRTAEALKEVDLLLGCNPFLGEAHHQKASTS